MAWTAVVDHLRAGELEGLPLVVGGRSLGARVACRTVGTTGAVGVLCLAFPAAAAPRVDPEPFCRDSTRSPVPTLVVQGESDPFGMPPAGRLRTVAAVRGNHSLRSNSDAVGAAVRAWLPGVVA